MGPVGEQRALAIVRVAGSAVLVLMLVLLAVFPAAPVEENTPGFVSPVIGFELAATPEQVRGILGAPGSPARAEAVRRMDLGNRLDFLFMVAYSALYVGIALLLAAHRRLPRTAISVLLGLAVLMWLGDLLENRELLGLSHADPSPAMTASLARLRITTSLKWYALFVASGIAAAGIWREAGWWRWSALAFGAAAALGLASLIHLPAIEWASYGLGLAWIMTLVRGFR
jgi:hypothetical protein